jgi:hypothetical protein
LSYSPVLSDEVEGAGSSRPFTQKGGEGLCRQWALKEEPLARFTADLAQNLQFTWLLDTLSDRAHAQLAGHGYDGLAKRPHLLGTVDPVNEASVDFHCVHR